MNTYPLSEKKLHCLNAFFAHVLDSEDDTFVEVRAAIEFLSHKLCLVDPLPHIVQTTRGIFELHGQTRSSCVLVHYHLEVPFVGMLWHQKKVLSALESVGDASKVVLLITGLQEAIFEGAAQTRTKQNRYQEIIAYTEALVLRKKALDQNLYIFFV